MLNLILNLAQINMKKERIEITHQIEKTNHVFYVNNQDKLNNSEVEIIKRRWGLKWYL